ncbi:MAG: GDYXXLXY domain-containing protein [Ghiorsea sp.]|nr:GDYXXLXY domain-containing protein [Ghiorsea sp.]
MRAKLAVFALLLSLGLVNWSMMGKEQHLAAGDIIYVQLAPVDPRSLMQGDYMTLRFELANQVYDALPKTKKSRRWRHEVIANDGFVVVHLDERKVATFKGVDDKEVLAKGDMLLRFRVRNGVVKFATNAYFFQEGHAQYYEAARFGQFRVDKSGELLLMALFDQDLKVLNAPKEAPL